MQERNVFLIRNVAPEKYGGGEIYQLKLAKKLSEAGFSPIIVSNSKELIRRAKKEGYLTLVPPYSKNQNWSGYRNVFLPAYQIFQIRLKRWYEEVLKYYKPVIVNIQTRDDMIAGTLAAKKYGVKVLWTDHADFKNWVLWNVNSRFKNVIGKRIIRLSKEVEKVIYISEKIEEETRRLIAPRILHNTIVINNGVEDELKKYQKVEPKEMSFVYVGRVVKDKGIEELIRAFQKVGEKYPRARLNIFGEGDITYYKKISLGCEGITFHGMTLDPLKALAENQVFVLPSYMEGLSLALIEAAMMGKVIIATDVGGNNEVVSNNETGLLVSPGSVEDLIEKMCYVLDHKKDVDRMSKNVRKRFEEKFDFDKIFAKKISPLYNVNKEKE